MNKVFKIICFLGCFLLYLSCASKIGRNPSFSGGRTEIGREGWVDKNTYVLVVSGQWDRKRYYNEDSPKDGDIETKEGKPSIILEQLAKRAAMEQAKRDFLEKVVGAALKSKTGTADGKLLEDVIQSDVTGKVPSPSTIKSQYTKNHDVRVTFQFSARGLKERVDKMVDKVIKSN